MKKNYDFKNLFILDMANNHQGDLQHGLNIINAMGEVVRKHGTKTALKFQFRELDTFIHPDYRQSSEPKHIQRFLSTRLDKKAFAEMTEAVRNAGMITMATPFDEASVDMLLDLDIEIIKVASCSATDKPLLQKIARVNKPVVVSTGGLTLSQIDRIVSFFEQMSVDFGLMHCVAIYPTPNEKLNLNQIALLRSRYPGVPVGWSTHESPKNIEIVQMAYALGAQMFERHVGLNSGKYKVNAYSSVPEEVDQWMAAFERAVEACGSEYRKPVDREETESLRSLMRGVFAAKDIKKGDIIHREDVFFAMPLLPDSLSSSEWSEKLVADKDYKTKEPLNAVVSKGETPEDDIIRQIVLQTKAMLNDAKIFVGNPLSIEISHHYGLQRFREFGCVIIDCVNRQYCKKLIVLLPRQKHPYHYHEKKEETFQLLYGDIEVELNGQRHKLMPGDTILVVAGVWHKFHTLDGCIFEEVSTTHYNDDSFYEDKAIAKLPREKRKTQIASWFVSKNKVL